MTERRRSPTEVNKLGRLPIPAAFEGATSSQAPPLESDWSAVNIVSFEAVNPQMSKNAGNCKTVADRCDGFAPPSRYATVFWAGITMESV